MSNTLSDNDTPKAGEWWEFAPVGSDDWELVQIPENGGYAKMNRRRAQEPEARMSDDKPNEWGEEWEGFIDESDAWRIRVPGGWLIDKRWAIDTPFIFIPDPPASPNPHYARQGGMILAIRILTNAGEEKCARLLMKELADMDAEP